VLLEQHPNSALSVGLNVVDSLEAINRGALDQEIDRLLDHLASLQRPVFLRFGYEFDGAANHYDPEHYKQAWIKFHRRMKEKQIDNVAMVWQSAAACAGTHNANPIAAWYPGDEVVDWVGLSYFAPAECDWAPGKAVLNFAREHHKPVMIAESAPRGYDVGQLTYSADGQNFRHKLSGAVWKEWFMPYFEFIRNHADVIKAVAYSNTFWDSHKTWGPPYANGYWGDARVQANKGVLERWKTEITDARYLQAAPGLFEKLGYTP
jgi:hypothetical protein